jgi:hypothetical protein
MLVSANMRARQPETESRQRRTAIALLLLGVLGSAVLIVYGVPIGLVIGLLVLSLVGGLAAAIVMRRLPRG